MLKHVSVKGDTHMPACSSCLVEVQLGDEASIKSLFLVELLSPVDVSLEDTVVQPTDEGGVVNVVLTNELSVPVTILRWFYLVHSGTMFAL